LAERRGDVFNYGKNENGEDNDDKDDKDDNNNDKVYVWAGALHWVSPNGRGRSQTWYDALLAGGER
jgi:hypothetical protein